MTGKNNEAIPIGEGQRLPPSLKQPPSPNKGGQGGTEEKGLPLPKGPIQPPKPKPK